MESFIFIISNVKFKIVLMQTYSILEFSEIDYKSLKQYEVEKYVVLYIAHSSSNREQFIHFSLKL